MISNKTNCIRCGIEITFAGEKPLLCPKCRLAPEKKINVRPVIIDDNGFRDTNFMESKKPVERFEKKVKKEKYESGTDL